MSSNYLRIENCVRKNLSAELGEELSKKTVLISSGATREFDGLTSDGGVVVEIKASKVPVKGKLRHTQLAEMSEACLFMLALEGAKRRILAISDKEFFSEYIRSSQATAARILGVEIIHVPCD